MRRLLVLPTSRAGWGLLIAFLTLIAMGTWPMIGSGKPGNVSARPALNSGMELSGYFFLRGGHADRQPYRRAR